MTISGHFFGNYNKIFHKTEVQTVILKCLTCLNPNCIKSNAILKHFFFHFLYFCKFVKKNMTHNGHFTTISGHFLTTEYNLSQNIGLDGHFEVLSVSKSCLDEKVRHNIG